MAQSAPPLWKILCIFLPLMLIGVTPVLLFMHFPNYMIIETQVISFFGILFLLNSIIPENHPVPLQRRLGPSLRWGDNLRVYLIILLTEFFIYLLSHNFSLFAFNFSENNNSASPPHLSTWLGLWAYFSLIVVMQHYAHYQARHVSFASGLFFRFKNTYLDIAIRRALGFYNLGINLFGIYLLITSILFIALNYYQPAALQHFHITDFLFWILFLFFSVCVQAKQIKSLLNRLAFSNIFYLVIASVCCTFAIYASTLLTQYFSLSDIFNNPPTKASLNLSFARPFLFVAIFILLTPFFSSLIVKYTENINRKKLLFFSFLLPNLFYLISIHLLSNKIVFIAMAIVFLIVFFSGKTTANFMTGVLPIPKQRVILPAGSYLLFPVGCLAPFNFYLLTIIIGPVSLYAILVTASLLSALMGYIGICSYFGKIYRTYLIRHKLNLTRLV